MSIILSVGAGLLLPFLVSFALLSMNEAERSGREVVLYGALSIVGLLLGVYLLFLSFFGLIALPLGGAALYLYRRREKGPRLVVKEQS